MSQHAHRLFRKASLVLDKGRFNPQIAEFRPKNAVPPADQGETFTVSDTNGWVLHATADQR